MKTICKSFVSIIIVAATAIGAMAQDSSTGSVVRRRDNGPEGRGANDSNPSTRVTERMQSRFEVIPTSDADLEWMRIIYRSLDLTKDANAPLYFPDEPIDGQENLFRIIMRLLANDEIAAYDYLDGREVFTDEYRVKVRDMLDRFHILYTDGKGSTEKHPKYAIDDSDVPANEILSYYIIEKWEFDRRNNKMHSVIEAICPVLHRSGDFGGEAIRYPMFWIKFDDLRPYLTTQAIFLSDDNNLPTCTYDDYFQLALYNGDIYKTRNLRNQSLMQLYPDPEDLKHAQDSIQQRLDSFENNLWVPSLEELAAARHAKDEEIDADDAPAVETKKTRTPRTARSTKKPKTPKAAKPKSGNGSSSSGNASRSVRNRRK